MSRLPFAALASIFLLTPLGALAEAGRPSLFTSEARAPTAAFGGAALLESGTDEAGGPPSPRIARVDIDGLGRVRDGVLSGRPQGLRLNLLNGVEFEARIERGAPTATGYTLSGPLPDVPFGRVVLVVNGGRTAGRVYTPQGNYAIHTTGAMQTVERMGSEPWRCGVEVPWEGADARDGGSAPSWPGFHGPGPGGFAPKRGEGAGARSRTPAPTEAGDAGASEPDDGNVVDVLVVYPSFARDLEGGYEPMLDLIDLDIATANEAYAASGVDLRVSLAAAVEVEYDWFLHERFSDADVTYVWGRALGHLARRDDGLLDEVHALRDRHAADLVLMHLGGRNHAEMGGYLIRGIAYRLGEVSRRTVEDFGFSVALSGDGTVVAHELGHSMGLLHDRHDDVGNEPFPYSHGFRYVHAAPWGDTGRHFSPATYGTVMSQHSRAGKSGFVLAFSNPQLSHPQDPELKLGVPGDEPSSAADGPADATRHLNELRGVLANVRAREDADPCRYEVTGDTGTLPPGEGAYRVRVETGAGCPWSASAGEWVASVSPASGTGSGAVEVSVGANDGWERPLEVLVAGRPHARRQAGSRAITPVCERSLEIKSWLVVRHPDRKLIHPPFDDETPCEDLNFDGAYLASVRHINRDRPSGTKYSGLLLDGSGLKAGDFDGLTGLAELQLEVAKTLPAGLFSGLTGLKRLRLVDAETLPAGLFSGLTGLRFLEVEPYFVFPRRGSLLRRIGPGAFRGLPGLLRLRILGHRVGTFSPGTFEGMPSLLGLEIWNGPPWADQEPPLPVTRFEPGALAGLPNLRQLWILAHSMEGMEAGVFNELGRLGTLSLRGNGLEWVAPGAFDGLRELRHLRLIENGLSTLPAGLFGDLATLENLAIWGNRLAKLPLGAFEGLRDLKQLILSSNRLATLEPGTFSGMPSLRGLDLQDNRLRNLQPGVFEGLESLDDLALRHNPLGGIRAGAFKGLRNLRLLYLAYADVTSLAPGVFDDTPGLAVLDLEKSRLRSIAPGTFRGLHLRGLHLGSNPGAPFAFAPRPVVHPAWDPAAGGPVEAAVEVLPEAPFPVDAALEASNGSLSAKAVHVPPGGPLGNAAVSVTPDGDGPVTVRVGQARWPEDLGREVALPPVGGGLVIAVDYRYGYSGFRVEPGPPLVLQGIADRALTVGRGPEAIDLADAFPRSLGPADYAAESSDGAVAAVSVEDGALAVSPRSAGSATVTVTATAADGVTLTREFRVTVRAPSVPLLLSGSNPQREGFVRLINRSDHAGAVRVTAFDDGGARFGPVDLRLKANGAAHFNSGDLEDGNAAKGLPEGIGAGQGDWRLEFESDLDIDALAYVRTRDGFVTGMHGTAPAEGGVHRIATFNPASNDRQVSRLRVVNPGPEAAEVMVRGVDDAGASPGGPVVFTVPAGAAREFTAHELEGGGPGLEGNLGDGEGKWRLEVESSANVAAMSLLESVATGHLTNLSSVPPPPGADGAHRLALFPAASRDWQGFARVVNRSDQDGTVRIEAYDDAGEGYGPLELSIGAGETAHFNSDDLELGNAGKGLSGSTGPGEGDWRLEMTSALDFEALGYVRTRDGFLAAVHDVAPLEDGRRRVAIFNPGSNHRQVSRLRLVNPTPRDVRLSVVGTDDAGGAPPQRGATWVLVPAGQALTLDAGELEAGVSNYQDRPVDDALWGFWARWPLGDGTGKWRLSVVGEPGVLVQSLLESPTGHLTNLSSDGR